MIGWLSDIVAAVKASRLVSWLFTYLQDPSFIPMFRETIRRYIVWWMYGLAVLEIIAILLKWMGINVPLVSKVAKDTLFGAKWLDNAAMCSLGYFFIGLGVHWFITWGRVPWEGRTATILGVLFWLVGIAYFIADKLDPNWTYWPLWAQWLRYPTVASLVGGIMAFVCFPQNSVWVPRRPW